MRGKEEAHDYRYFPDPDLVPIDVASEWVESIRNSMPELPNARRERFITEFKLPEYDASVITEDRELADYFEAVASHTDDAKMVSNWIMGSLLWLLNAAGKSIDQSPISAPELAQLLKYPVTNTLMGLGSLPASDPQFIGMLGMHGTYEANMGMHNCDVLIAIGARFDDRVTGKLDDFALNANVIHVEIDPSEVDKNGATSVAINADVSQFLNLLDRDPALVSRRRQC